MLARSSSVATIKSFFMGSPSTMSVWWVPYKKNTHRPSARRRAERQELGLHMRPEEINGDVRNRPSLSFEKRCVNQDESTTRSAIRGAKARSSCA
jgi:hypothetical protein